MTATAPLALDARLTVCVGQGSRAFRLEAELTLDAGVLILFGPSGVGKTLTLKALAGLERPNAGHVRVGAETLFDSDRGVSVPVHARRVGYVPQQHGLFPFANVAGNVAFGLSRSDRTKQSPKITQLLDELGLASLAGADVSSLSGGERQRVALARALAVEPRILLLDEPFASIDAEGRRVLGRLLRDVVERRGIPAVLVTHDVSDAAALGDRLIRFERGKTVAVGVPSETLGSGTRAVLSGAAAAGATAIGGGRARLTLNSAVVEGPAQLLPDSPGLVELEVLL